MHVPYFYPLPAGVLVPGFCAVPVACLPPAACASLICPASPAGSAFSNAATSRPTSPATISGEARGYTSAMNAPARNSAVMPSSAPGAGREWSRWTIRHMTIVSPASHAARMPPFTWRSAPGAALAGNAETQEMLGAPIERGADQDAGECDPHVFLLSGE